MWKGFQKPKRSCVRELERSLRSTGGFRAAFERGWGTTVGNALRRALLSSTKARPSPP